MTSSAAVTTLKAGMKDVARRIGGVPEQLSIWRARRRASPAWTTAVALILCVMLLPIGAIALLALGSNTNEWPHLVSTILPEALANTLALSAGIGALTLFVGVASAWLITMYRFPGRAVLDRLLVIPLAMPTYIVAYCYAELLDYAGPIQTELRLAFGWTSPRDYWFPQIASLPGAVFVMASVLYPYVYLAARATFVQQSVCVLEVARTLGRTALGAFWAVALPLARPALAAGLALVLMESLNDLGAVQHLGVETLSASIYRTWLQRSNLGGAAQIASVALVFIFVLFAMERAGRGEALYHHTTGRFRSIPFQDIEGWRGYAAMVACALPFIAGFAIPFLVLARFATSHFGEAIEANLMGAIWNSVALSGVSATIAVLVALVLAYARRVSANGFTRPAVRLTGLGYAIPGTVLAIGILIPLAGLDNAIDGISSEWFGYSTGLMLSGSIFALVLAYVIRFMAVGLGGIEAGFERISPNLDAAARALGETALTALWHVHLPLLLPALGAAALMVFVDCIKELPATLLLRPFNFETLATQVFNLVALEQFERSAAAALTIVVVALFPVLLLHQAVAGGRAGQRRLRSGGSASA
jgi:iron(III) transport system permease protein